LSYPRVLAVLLAAVAAAGTLVAQPPKIPCTPPPSAQSQEPNIFSEQQEVWLGEEIAKTLVLDHNIIPDPQRDRLQRLGDRLAAQLPPTQYRFRFTIIDLPDANAFGIPGGYIYISRRMIAMAGSEDELAAILGHEIGHMYTREIGRDLTRSWLAVLGPTQLGDRNDVIDKWNPVRHPS